MLRGGQGSQPRARSVETLADGRTGHESEHEDEMGAPRLGCCTLVLTHLHIAGEGGRHYNMSGRRGLGAMPGRSADEWDRILSEREAR